MGKKSKQGAPENKAAQAAPENKTEDEGVNTVPGTEETLTVGILAEDAIGVTEDGEEIELKAGDEVMAPEEDDTPPDNDTPPAAAASEEEPEQAEEEPPVPAPLLNGKQRVVILKDIRGVDDGEIYPTAYVAGEEYIVGPSLARALLEVEAAELVA